MMQGEFLLWLLYREMKNYLYVSAKTKNFGICRKMFKFDLELNYKTYVKGAVQ